MRMINADELKACLGGMYMPEWVRAGINTVIDNVTTIKCENCDNKSVQYTIGFQDGLKGTKHGRWIKENDISYELNGQFETYTRAVCSECNQANTWGEVPFCPWCGARMIDEV